jgi:mono/diheme cytochrome c family protein
MFAVLGLSLLAAITAQAEPPSGRDDYQRYCSACHGEAADGKGPVANVLKPDPPALTQLHERYGRPLGTALVAYVLGDTMPRAHGTSDMPVWGRNLAEADGDDTRAVQTIWRIVGYLESIQTR